MCPMRSLRAVAVACAVVVTTGCGGPAIFSPTSPPAVTGVSEVPAPEWRVGDRWTYEWTSGQERGTRTLEVSDVPKVNGVDYYVVDLGGSLQQYYTKELHFAAGVQAARVLARMVPPQPWFMWPLKTDARWTYEGMYEEQ